MIYKRDEKLDDKGREDRRIVAKSEPEVCSWPRCSCTNYMGCEPDEGLAPPEDPPGQRDDFETCPIGTLQTLHRYEAALIQIAAVNGEGAARAHAALHPPEKKT